MFDFSFTVIAAGISVAVLVGFLYYFWREGRERRRRRWARSREVA
jgi:heme A synthase